MGTHSICVGSGMMHHRMLVKNRKFQKKMLKEARSSVAREDCNEHRVIRRVIDQARQYEASNVTKKKQLMQDYPESMLCRALWFAEECSRIQNAISVE